MVRLALVLSLLLCATRAHALEPNDRHGWMVGLGIGYGPAKLLLGPALRDTTTKWIGGVSAQLRVARSLSPHWAVGLEHKQWLDEQGFGTSKVRANIQNLAATVTWFPGGDRTGGSGGIYLKAGAGWAHGRFTIFQNASGGVDTTSVESHIDESGLGVLGGAGYEFRVVRSLAVAADVSINYQSVKKPAFDHNWYVPFALGLNWYFL